MLATANHVHHFVTNYSWLLTKEQLRVAVKRLDFNKPYGLMKNVTGKFMLLSKELVMDGCELSEPQALFMLKCESSKRRFNGEIEASRELRSSASDVSTKQHNKTAFLQHNISPDALIARSNDTFMQVKKRTSQLVLNIAMKG